MYHNKRLPKGIRIVGADAKSVSKEEELSLSQGGAPSPRSPHPATQFSGEPSGADRLPEEEQPWGYIYVRHLSVDKFEEHLQALPLAAEAFRPRVFVHRTVQQVKKAHAAGKVQVEKPTMGGLVFLQGTTVQLQAFLQQYFPQFHLVNDCSTHRPASIPHRQMRPFMQLMAVAPERVTFLRDPFVKFARNHVRLRVLTGPMAGQEGYVVRILRNRQLVMDIGGYAVAISDVHREDFEIAE